MNGLYGLTLPHGSVPVDGVQRLSETFDRIGLMARDPRDLAALAKVILKSSTDSDANAPEPAYEGEDDPAGGVWEGLSVGILDSEWGTHPSAKWKWGSDEVVRDLTAKTFPSGLADSPHLEREIRLGIRADEGTRCKSRLPSQEPSSAGRTTVRR